MSTTGIGASEPAGSARMRRSLRWADTEALMTDLNNELAEAASASGADFLSAPLSASWSEHDFVDDGHFNAAGARKFAGSIAEDIRRLCQ